MVWREQGLGDEILFLSLIPDLINVNTNIIIECEPRLVDIIKRSFPVANVREPIIMEIEDYDYQIPIGSLCKYFRKVSEISIKPNPI